MTIARAVILVLLVAAGAAHADGAFPESLQILAPADRPHEIVLATNYGLAVTHDDGATWRWICEEAIASYAALFQIGPPPGDTLFAVAPQGLAVSRDDGCTWSLAGGSLAAAYVYDAFPDPTDGNHLFAVARPRGGDGLVPISLYESRDSGATFGAPRYSASLLESLNGIEIARAQPATVYATLYSDRAGATGPSVLRSNDAGLSFTRIDETGVRDSLFFIAAVDPIDPLRVYFRIRNGGGDLLGITTDGGATVRIALSTPDLMTAFLRRADGTLLVGGREAHLSASSDGGLTFTARPNPPHVRALAERAGTLYAAGDNLIDHFALAVSRDSAMTWQPLLRFEEIVGPLDCPNIRAICAGPWAQLMSVYGFGSSPPGSSKTPPVDAGTPRPSQLRSGCACAFAGASSSASPLWLVLVALVLLRRGLPSIHRLRSETRRYMRRP